MIPGMDKEHTQNHSIPELSGFQYASKRIAEVQRSLELAALPASALLRCAEAQCRLLRQFLQRLLQGNLPKGFGRERHRVSSESGLNIWLCLCPSGLHNCHDTCWNPDTFTIDMAHGSSLGAACDIGQRSTDERRML